MSQGNNNDLQTVTLLFRLKLRAIHSIIVEKEKAVQTMKNKMLSQSVADNILSMITIEKRFTAGDKLPNELELSNELNVSRTTLREAIRIPMCAIPRIITDMSKKALHPYTPRRKKAITGGVAPATGMPRRLL